MSSLAVQLQGHRRLVQWESHQGVKSQLDSDCSARQVQSQERSPRSHQSRRAQSLQSSDALADKAIAPAHGVVEGEKEVLQSNDSDFDAILPVLHPCSPRSAPLWQRVHRSNQRGLTTTNPAGDNYGLDKALMAASIEALTREYHQHLYYGTTPNNSDEEDEKDHSEANESPLLGSTVTQSVHEDIPEEMFELEL